MPGTPWQQSAGLDHPAVVDHARTVDAVSTDPARPHLAWLGHASILLDWHGVRLLLDPVFGNLAGLVRRRLPRPPESAWAQLDAILLTHGHMDHLGPQTLRTLPRVPIHLPRPTETFLPRDLRPQARPGPIGETWTLGALTIHRTPARHGGWRYPWQQGYVASGYLVSDGTQSVYLAGDSAWGPHFAEIGRTHRPNIAVLPIGAYAPAWFLRKRHLNPPEALDAFEALSARRCIPYHFGTYRLSLEPLSQPLAWFATEAQRRGIDWELPTGLLPDGLRG